MLGRFLGDQTGLVFGQSQLRGNPVDTGNDPASHIVFAELRQDIILDNDTRQCIGHDPFETIADFDAHLAFIGRDQQDQAIVLFRLAVTILTDAPGPPKLIAIVGDIVAFETIDRRDDQLAIGLGFQRGQFRGEISLLRRIEQIRLIDDATGKFREALGKSRIGYHQKGGSQAGDDSFKRH